MRKSLLNFIENEEKLMIYYLDDHGNLTQRIIKMIRINDENLLAYCYYRKRVRTFKLANILSWGKTGSKASA